MQICIQEMKGCNAFSIKCTAAIILSVMICIFSSVPAPANTKTFSSDVVPASKIPELPVPVDSALVELPPDSTEDRLAINNIKIQNTLFLFNSFNRYAAAKDSIIFNKIKSKNISQLNGRDSLTSKSLSQKKRTIEGKSFIDENALLTQSDSLAIFIKVIRKRPLKITWYQNWEQTNTHMDTSFYYKPESKYQNVDTVTAVLSDLRSDSTLIRSWYLMKPVILDSAGIFVYRLSADSTFFEIDTLRYQGLGEIFADSAFAEYLNSGDSIQQYLQTMQVDSNATDSSLIRSVLEGFSKDLATDSIPHIFEVDSLFEQTDSLSAAFVMEDQLRDPLLSDSLFQDTSGDSGGIIDSLSIIIADSLIDSTRNTQDDFQADSGDSALSIQSYLPAADTVCTYGDTLRFYTQPTDGGEQHIFYQWFVNDSLIEGESDSVFIFIPVRDAHSIDTVSVSISDTSNNYIGEISWQIAKQKPKNFMPQILSFLPQDTLLSFSEDALFFSIKVYDQEQDSIIYNWFLNDSLMQNSTDSAYSYFPDDSVNFNDTIRVGIRDSVHDSTTELSWIIAPSLPEITTPFFEAFPPADTLLAIRDSLLFGSYIKNVEPDTIEFKWLLNGQIIENTDDSTYLYFCRNKFQEHDTLSLLVSGAEKDTITNHRWIISKYSSSEVIDELIFSPEADTFVTKGDSLLISVVYNIGEDSLKYVWFLNGELIYDHPDSIYTYKPDTAGFKIDTVQLFVIDAINDTSRAHEWLISNEKPRIPLKLATAFPATDTTIFRGDSLQFIARLQSPRPDSVSFRWFVNEEEI
ncbi:hypothetical protein GF337_09390, partial [candidate division KSB1 bacterium]|nr:hypothetical protein [candidate division KSB1 bacterium]